MSKRRIKGNVVSDKMQATVVVSVDVLKKHPVYEKFVKVTKKFKAHDEMGVKQGDTIIIEESRPYSKDVTWKVVEKLEEK